MKIILKKYESHILLIALILFSIGVVFFLKRYDAIIPKNPVYFSLNALLHLPEFKFNLSLYLYYLIAFIAAIVLFLFPKKWQWLWLLVLSYLFLAIWELYFFLILLVVTSLAYFLALFIENKRAQVSKTKIVLLLGLALFIGILCGIKYGAVFSNHREYQIIMPLGLSYFSFQAISYIVDVYYGKIKAEKHFGLFAVYMSFFPRLFVGPIERAGNFISQIKEGISFDANNLVDGLVRIFWGLFKKVILVNRLVVVTQQLFVAPEKLSSLELWVGVILCGFYLYFDFSACIDIALGVSKMFGITSVENFNHPYLATSVIDFWRRWHISLSSWLRDYVFLPLNFATRKQNTKFAQSINILITFLISGIWHGSSLNYIVWGGFHGILQIIENGISSISALINKKLKINLHIIKPFSILITFLVVNLCWVFFFTKTLKEAFNIFSLLFAGTNILSFDNTKFGLAVIDFQIMRNMIFFLIGIELFEEGLHINILEKIRQQNIAIRWTIYLVCLFVLIIFGYYGLKVVNIDPFYMQF